MIDILHHDRLIASLKRDREFVLKYIGFDIANLISLSLPNSQKFIYLKNWVNIGRYHLNLEELGKKIKQLRKERGYTQEEFAKLIGISRATLSKIENGIFAKVSALVLSNALSTLGYELSLEVKNPFVKR